MGSLLGHELSSSSDRQRPVADTPESVYSRRFHQRPLERTPGPRSASELQCSAVVATPLVGGPDPSAFVQPVGGSPARTARMARICTAIPSASGPGCAHAQRISLTGGSQRLAVNQRCLAIAFDRAGGGMVPHRSAHRRDRLAGGLRGIQKKDTQTYTAHRAALGGRTLKTGQSRCFVGYKKHTFRLWWREYAAAVLLVPLVSWVTPANVSEGGLLVPSLRYCERRWSWWPQIVVADMGYLAAEAKMICRKCWRVAVVTKLRLDMKLVPPYVAWNRAECSQGQPLRWLEYAPLEDRHWFGVNDEPSFCQHCWEASRCPREFAFAPAEHETLLGLLPLASLPAQRLLQTVRPWIEPTQSYEKNQLGLSQVFFNSLRLTWCMALLADAAVLLRTHALLHAPAQHHLLRELAPQQGLLDLGEDGLPELNAR
jgi:hypothetical protein